MNLTRIGLGLAPGTREDLYFIHHTDRVKAAASLSLFVDSTVKNTVKMKYRFFKTRVCQMKTSRQKHKTSRVCGAQTRDLSVFT